MAKFEINSPLPPGYKVVNGKVVRTTPRSKKLSRPSKDLSIRKPSGGGNGGGGSRDYSGTRMVQIGDQCWMAENLNVAHYKNGDEIPTGYSNSEWADLDETETGAYAVYGDNESNADTYGYLYNWYAVDDSRGVCPEDWHIPTDEEYTALSDYLGGESVAGGKMKECTPGSCPDSDYWPPPNTGATNESGFTGLPGGFRNTNNGYYGNMGIYGYFWSSTENYNYSAWNRLLNYNYSDIVRYYYNKRNGFSVRCIRD